MSFLNDGISFFGTAANKRGNYSHKNIKISEWRLEVSSSNLKMRQEFINKGNMKESEFDAFWLNKLRYI